MNATFFSNVDTEEQEEASSHNVGIYFPKSEMVIMRWLIQAHEIILNLSDHHPFLHTFFPYGSASAQLAETQRPDPLHKTCM